MYDEVEKLLIGEDIYLDTSFIAASEKGDPGWLDPARALRMIRRHGPERVLFGSDSPWCDQGRALRWLEGLGLSKYELEMISGGNAAKLLDLE